MLTTAHLFVDGSDIQTELKALTIKDIISAGAPVAFGRADSRLRKHLLETVSCLSAEDQDCIQDFAAHKHGHAMTTCIDSSGHDTKKRKISHDTDDNAASLPLLDHANFLQPPTQELVEAYISRFIDRTANDSLATSICVACAREIPKVDIKEVLISTIPHQEMLIPTEPHLAHELTNGMLLYSPAIVNKRGTICNGCMLSLTKVQIPPHSLANGMWIGNVPFELAVLTLPERVLIARHLPAAHSVKLFPMKKGSSSLNSGL